MKRYLGKQRVRMVIGLIGLFTLGLVASGAVGAAGFAALTSSSGPTTTDASSSSSTDTTTSSTDSSSTSTSTDTTSTDSTTTDTTSTDTTSTDTTTTDTTSTDTTSTDTTTTGETTTMASTQPATLATDSNTYHPGDTVSVTGSNWTPGESVHIHAADTDGQNWSYDTDVTAGNDGSLGASFQLPISFAGGFAVAATGAIEGTVSTSFSDEFAAVTGPPAIISDQTDYAPGSTVTLTGTGWQPLEPVHIFVNDSIGQTWSYNVDVSADGSGNFTNQFQLPNSFVANYSVTATGDHADVATSSFTDSQPISVTVANTSTGATSL